MTPDVSSVAGRPALLLGAFDIDDVGYAAQEYFVSGTASSYAPASELGPDGRWSVTATDTADYTTRIVVLTPSDPGRFNGTALVEWLNVSGGIDAPAVWMMAHREVIRAGYAYVTVSAQKVGVDGGVNMLGFDLSLKSQNPERYAALSHPGDAFAYDIFSQIGGLVRDAGLDGILAGLTAEHVLALGESQSAMFLTTYINSVDPLAKVYDGFLVHSRLGPVGPLDSSSIFDELQSSTSPVVKFRADLRVPLMAIITETDLYGAGRQGYYGARQPDHDLLRVWEIAGAAHADNYTIQVAAIDSGFAPVEDLVAAWAPTDNLMGQQLDHFINFGPQHHYVLQASLSALSAWVRTGTAPPSAEPLTVRDDGHPEPVLDAHGIAEGGVRTPWVDVPIARTSGAATGDNLMAAIFGSGEPFDDATLRRLYPGGVADYVAAFTAALDQAIGKGMILAADRDEILQIATASFPGG
ncbi:alpha/beta hydrolase domain-containing protein [Mycobacterium asiaticum]|uniref:alpha/beta hydrolase domain-containing protein n=1 Tax=Mycobacterium asiaticum TaxID=1790 RepID=UPI000AE33D45|nr:alpha/beta hydrolase domain-containing protein [Mycobacterium asiaticum]